MKYLKNLGTMVLLTTAIVGCGGGEVEQRPVSSERPSGFGADGEGTKKKSNDAAAPSTSMQ
jgi:hypothetical protein